MLWKSFSNFNQSFVANRCLLSSKQPICLVSFKRSHRAHLALCPLSHGGTFVDDRQRITSDIVWVTKLVWQWKHPPRLALIKRVIIALSVENHLAYLIAFSFFQQGVRPQRVMIDATPLKGHDTAASLQKKRADPRQIGCTKGGLNSKLHSVREKPDKLI